jgi:hypothetical protein
MLRAWQGSGWSDPLLPVYRTEGGKVVIQRLWYSPDGSTWAPRDAPSVATVVPGVPRNLVALANSSSQITLSWAAPAAPGSLAGYALRYNSPNPPVSSTETGGPLIYSGSGLSVVHSGLSPSTQYGYRLIAYTIDGKQSPAATATATTLAASAPPVQNGSLTGPGAGSGSGNTSGTRKTLSAGSFTMPVSGTITGVTFWAHGYSGRNGIGTLIIDGVDVASASLSQNGGANTISCSYRVSAGAHTLAMRTGGDNSTWTEWRPYSGGSWSTTIQWTGLTYTYT